MAYRKLFCLKQKTNDESLVPQPASPAMLILVLLPNSEATVNPTGQIQSTELHHLACKAFHRAGNLMAGEAAAAKTLRVAAIKH